jgi:hypothetical protein
MGETEAADAAAYYYQIVFIAVHLELILRAQG